MPGGTPESVREFHGNQARERNTEENRLATIRRAQSRDYEVDPLQVDLPPVIQYYSRKHYGQLDSDGEGRIWIQDPNNPTPSPDESNMIEVPDDYVPPHSRLIGLKRSDQIRYRSLPQRPDPGQPLVEPVSTALPYMGSLDDSVLMVRTSSLDFSSFDQAVGSLLNNDFVFTWSYNGYKLAGDLDDLELGMMEVDGRQVPIRTPADMKVAVTQRNEAALGVLRGDAYDTALQAARQQGYEYIEGGVTHRALPGDDGERAFEAHQAELRRRAEEQSHADEADAEQDAGTLSVRELTMMERLPKNIVNEPEFKQVDFWTEAQANPLVPHARERRQIEGTDRYEFEGAGYKLIFPHSSGDMVRNWSFAESLISLRSAANVNEFRISGERWAQNFISGGDPEVAAYLGLFTGPNVEEMIDNHGLPREDRHGEDNHPYGSIFSSRIRSMSPGTIRTGRARQAYSDFMEEKTDSFRARLRDRDSLSPSSHIQSYRIEWAWGRPDSAARGIPLPLRAQRNFLSNLYERILRKIAASPAAVLKFGGVDIQRASQTYAQARHPLVPFDPDVPGSGQFGLLSGAAYQAAYNAVQHDPEQLAAFLDEQQQLRQEVYASLSQQQTRRGEEEQSARSITQFTQVGQLEEAQRVFAFLSIDAAANIAHSFIESTFGPGEFPTETEKGLWHSNAGRWLRAMASTPGHFAASGSGEAINGLGLTWSRLLPFIFPADPYMAYQFAQNETIAGFPERTFDQLSVDWASYYAWFADTCSEVMGWWDTIGQAVRGPNPATQTIRNFYNDTYVSYHYHAFSPDTSFVLDYESYHTLAQDDYQAMRSPSENYISINPEYNYYSKNYEEAITPDDIPEAILPNMYVYSFVTDINPDPASLNWQGLGHYTAGNQARGDNQRELQQQNLDRVITLDEFEIGILPIIGGSEGNERELNNFKQHYLSVLADKMSSGGITIDTRTAAATDYYNTLLPATEQRIGVYERLNPRKAMFPMYIEISFPTAPPGPIGNLIAAGRLSTSVANAFIVPGGRMESKKTFQVTQNGFRFPSGGPTIPPQWGDDQLALMRYRSQTPPMEPSQLRRRQDMQMWSIDEFLQTLRHDIEALVVSDGEYEQCRGQCMLEGDEQMVTFLGDAINEISDETHITYEEFFGGRRNCNSETLVYKLIKKDAKDGSVIQNFYFPVNDGPQNLIKFVDTQVKYDKKYNYEINAFQLVYGSEFRQRVISSQPQISRPETGPSSDLPVYFTIAVETIPDPIIIEFPVTTRWPNLSSGQHKGVYLPGVRVLDTPPPPPSVQVVPFRDNYRQALFNFQPGWESFIGPRSLTAVSLGISDPNNKEISKNASHQVQFENFALRHPKLEFKNEGGQEITRIELYSTTTAPAAQNAWDITNFNDPVILDISGDPEVEEAHRAAAFDYTATMTPNLKYYYFARAADVHGNYSNPTPIYEVELSYEKGLYIPRIRLYIPPPELTQSSSKKMTRFLEIKPAKIQTAVINTGTGESRMGLVSDGEAKVENNTFMIKVTSKDTGRKVYFYLNFSKKHEDPDDIR